MKGTEVFVHTNLFVERAPNLFLPLASWRILHALDGETDVESLARRLRIDYPKLVTLMEELLKDGWIEEHVLSLEEFEEFLKKHTEETQSGAPKGEASVPTSKAIQPETVPDVVPLQKKTGRVLRVSRVIDFLNNHAASALAAQATIYLIFSRLPRELVEREGISTIHLRDDSTFIEGRELQDALSAVIYSVAQQRLPESMFENR